MTRRPDLRRPASRWFDRVLNAVENVAIGLGALALVVLLARVWCIWAGGQP